MKATSCFIELSQATIAFFDSKPTSEKGDSTVIFIHGHCTNKSFFLKQIGSSLSTSYRLIALDLPGYGESSPPKDPEKVYSFPGFAEVLLEFINALQLRNIVIVGWSLGGHVALELTLQLSQLKGLVITGTPPIEVSKEGLSRGFKAVDPQSLACFGKGNLTFSEAELMATISGYDYTEEKKFIVEAILKTDEGAKTIYPRSISEGVGQNEVKIVEEWEKPLCVIVGEKDGVINNDYIMNDVKYKNLWENKVHVIFDASHAVHMEKAHEFNAILERFLKHVFKESFFCANVDGDSSKSSKVRSQFH